METFAKFGTAVEDGVLESIRIGGEFATSAARSVREQADRFVPAIPAFDVLDNLPSPVEIAEHAFDFGTKLADAQHQAVVSFLTALSGSPTRRKKS